MSDAVCVWFAAAGRAMIGDQTGFQQAANMAVDSLACQVELAGDGALAGATGALPHQREAQDHAVDRASRQAVGGGDLVRDGRPAPVVG